MPYRGKRRIRTRWKGHLPFEKKRTWTEVRMAADQVNGKRARGPATSEGRDCMVPTSGKSGRATTLPLKLKRYERQMETLENAAICQNVIEEKGVSRRKGES
jgi:hypothetical protein